MEGVGMEQAGGETVGWFDGLPWQMWVGVFIGWAVLVTVILLINRMPHDADLRVRGWEDRQKHTDGEDEWWAREYPTADDELPGMWERADFEGGKHG